jgi:ubiquinone/menaquinone biosynthesis C-methylase UbiE
MSAGPTFERTWRKRFESFAAHRDDEAGIAGWSASGLEARVRRFLALWRAPRAGERWLDAGCGAGTYLRLLQKDGLEVTGVDYSLVTLSKARRRPGQPARCAVADIRHLPFARGCFDGLLCFGVLQAMTDSASVVDELCRVVKPGGEVWLDALNRRCLVHSAELLRRRLQGKPMHLRYEAPATLYRALRRAGMADIRVYWMPILPSRWRRWQPLLESRPAVSALGMVPLLGLLTSHAFIVRARRP